VKIKSIILFFTITGIVLLSSCDPQFIQKTYIVNSPNVNCFQNENEKNIKLTGSGHQVEVQSDIALTNKYGIAATLFAGGWNPLQYGGEIGGIYFKSTPDDKFHYELQAGYGYFKDRSDIYRDLSPSYMTYKNWYRQNVNTNYHKLYIQPTAFIVKKWFKIGLSAKINAVYYTDYNFHYEKEEQDQNSDVFYISDSQFKNKLGFVFEPVLTIKIGKIFYIQAVKPFSTRICNSQLLKNWNVYSENDGSLKNPQVLSLLLNVGMEFKLEKRKTKPKM